MRPVVALLGVGGAGGTGVELALRPLGREGARTVYGGGEQTSKTGPRRKQAALHP